MRRIRSAWIGLVLLTGAGPASAQVADGPAPGGRVLGRVVSAETGEPIAGASVAAWSPADSSIVTGAVAGGDGAFLVEAMPPGTYYVLISSIGYQSHRSANFTLDPASPRADLGTIRLAGSNVAAEEIQVTLERSTMTLEPDRNTYLAADIAPAAATAGEVLEAVPSVFVDTDGSVSLRGDASVAVQINGQPVPVSGDQLAAYLQQLPADAIDRVEVIPTPSARYNPEGTAGIINIVMRRNTDLGTSGGITLGAATTANYDLGANLGYQAGPITLFTTYGFNQRGREVRGFNLRELRDESGASLLSTEQDFVGDSDRRGHTLTANLEYRLGELDAVTNALSLHRRSSTDEAFSAYTELDASRSVTDRYARPREEEEESFLVDYTLGYRRAWDPRNHELSAEIRFERDTDAERTLRWRQPVSDGSSRIDLETEDVDETERELTAEVDYVRTLGESSKLETGYRGDAEWLDQEQIALEDSLGTGAWLPSPLSEAFAYREEVHAVYGVLSRRAGRFELQAGLRAEYATRDLAVAGQSFPHDYTSLFPSAIAVYSPSEATQFKLSYSRRVDRPWEGQLNPIPRFDDVQNVRLGNPELDPEYTHAFELGYTRSGALGSLQIAPYYRHTTDIIRVVLDTEDVVDGREVTSIRFANLATSDAWGTDFNGSLEIGDRFDGFASFNVFQLVTDGGPASSLSTDAVSWSARANGTLHLSPTLRLQAMTFYRAPREVEGGEISSFKRTSLTLQQELWDDRARLSLRVIDPFDTMAFRSRAGDENVIQISEREFDARALRLTFQYTFGKRPENVRRPEPDTEDEPEGIFP
jgi:outer membrane receptor protein involved in Fe transport